MMRYWRLLFLMTMGAWVASAQTSATPVYACVVVKLDALVTFHVIDEGQQCPEGQNRMLVVAQRSVAFVANPPVTITAGPPSFAATLMTSKITLDRAEPLLVVVTLNVTTDFGLYTIPQGLTCGPLLDGQALGSPVALTAPQSYHRGVATYSPNRLWSLAQAATVAAAGGHSVSMRCVASSPFYFRGQGTLMVLQQVGG